jgi:hypothetical protein
MKKTPGFFATFAFAASLFASLPVFAENAPAPDGEYAAAIQPPAEVSADALHQAIVTAAKGRGWTIKSDDTGRMVLFLEQNGWRSTLTLVYSAKEISIYSNSDKLDKMGKPKKHAIPSWVKYLKQDIRRNLGMNPRTE